MAKGLLAYPLRKVVSSGTYWNKWQQKIRTTYTLECGHKIDMLEGNAKKVGIDAPKRMRCEDCGPK